MRRSSGSGIYALIIVVVLIGACIFGVMMLQGIVSTTDPSTVEGTELAGINQTVNATLTGIFSGSMLPVWILIIAGFCIALYVMVRAAKRR